MIAMDFHGHFRRSALELGIPEDEVGKFDQLLRFEIWSGGEPHGTPVGRRGGRPRLPEDVERQLGGPWELPFVASYDCAALPGIDDLALPSDGSLLFFLDHEEAVEADSEEDAQRYARVVYVPAESGLSVDGGYDLFATVQPELPHWVDMDEEELSGYQRQQVLDLPHRSELVALVGRLWPKSGQGEIRLGGYSGHIGALSGKNVYATPEIEMAWKNIKDRKAGMTPDEAMFCVEEELQQVMREWTPLAQFRADYVHVGRFLIRREDLAARRLDKVFSVTEFLE
ncbi:YwqG family protein [Lentzea sp. NBC_00516]|uniref:DUF1963 domain-containing protein n=1 Tax=Lentzea sp. NBC_00516 TaxID=2903582 RepID=UPI002E80DB9F|nr:DUF1963 domain-containing protein [Lentzea sp. NBC_00516]WUD27837.1 YwqG family protein [Lentzea sp. NBC_00516]